MRAFVVEHPQGAFAPVDLPRPVPSGNSLHGRLEETTEAQFDEIFNVHVKGVYFLTLRLLSLMNNGGRIVNISGGLTRISLPGGSAYGAAKGPVEVLTRYMAKELGPPGITANVVAPGGIETDFSGGILRDNPEVNKRVAEMTALGRAGVPDDIGPMIAALLLDENRWVNAQRIEVSGGIALQRRWNPSTSTYTEVGDEFRISDGRIAALECVSGNIGGPGCTTAVPTERARWGLACVRSPERRGVGRGSSTA
jgi:hypothetical protein